MHDSDGIRDDFLKVPEIADRLRVSLFTAYEHVRRGRIRSYRFGTQWRVRESDFARFISEAEMPLNDDGRGGTRPFATTSAGSGGGRDAG